MLIFASLLFFFKKKDVHLLLLLHVFLETVFLTIRFAYSIRLMWTGIQRGSVEGVPGRVRGTKCVANPSQHLRHSLH